MNKIILISPFQAIGVFKQLGFETLISANKEIIETYIHKNALKTKVIVYDISLKEIINPFKEQFKTSEFPIFMALAFNENQKLESLNEMHRQIENAVGVKIE
ncbi:MAG: hypothetical protein WCZ24_02120 [Bacilli bacterium]